MKYGSHGKMKSKKKSQGSGKNYASMKRTGKQAGGPKIINTKKQPVNSGAV